jgi:hypothetical protein
MDGGDLGSRAQAVDAENEFLNCSPVSWHPDLKSRTGAAGLTR